MIVAREMMLGPLTLRTLEGTRCFRSELQWHHCTISSVPVGAIIALVVVAQCPGSGELRRGRIRGDGEIHAHHIAFPADYILIGRTNPSHFEQAPLLQIRDLMCCDSARAQWTGEP